MTTTRQELHQFLRQCLDSGEWDVDELHQAVNDVYENFQDDEATDLTPEDEAT